MSAQWFRKNVEGLSGFVPQHKTIAITSAQILNIANVSLSLIPGDAGKVILPFACIYRYIFNTTPYTIASSADFFFLAWNNSAPPQPPANNLQYLFMFDFIDQSANQIAPAGYNFGDPADETGIAGSPLLLSAAAAGNPTLGDGTLEVTVLYHVIELP